MNDVVCAQSEDYGAETGQTFVIVVSLSQLKMNLDLLELGKRYERSNVCITMGNGPV